MASTRIVKQIGDLDYHALITKYRNRIRVSDHALVRFSQKQRNIYKDDYSIMTLLRENPRLVGLQKNGRYAAWFRKSEGYIRIIFAVNESTCREKNKQAYCSLTKDAQGFSPE